MVGGDEFEVIVTVALSFPDEILVESQLEVLDRTQLVLELTCTELLLPAT